MAAVVLYREPFTYSDTHPDTYITVLGLTMPSFEFCVAALSLVALAQCHSYVVEARKVEKGTFVGAPGYPRAYGMVQIVRRKTYGHAVLIHQSRSFFSYV